MNFLQKLKKDAFFSWSSFFHFPNNCLCQFIVFVWNNICFCFVSYVKIFCMCSCRMKMGGCVMEAITYLYIVNDTASLMTFMLYWHCIIYFLFTSQFVVCLLECQGPGWFYSLPQRYMYRYFFFLLNFCYVKIFSGCRYDIDFY